MEVGVPSSQPAGTSTPPLPPNTSLVKQPTPTLGTDMQSFATLIRAFRECKQILCMSSPSAAASRAENAPHPKAATGHRQGLLKCISGRLGLGGGPVVAFLRFPSHSKSTSNITHTKVLKRWGGFSLQPPASYKDLQPSNEKIKREKDSQAGPTPLFPDWGVNLLLAWLANGKKGNGAGLALVPGSAGLWEQGGQAGWGWGRLSPSCDPLEAQTPDPNFLGTPGCPALTPPGLGSPSLIHTEAVSARLNKTTSRVEIYIFRYLS